MNAKATEIVNQIESGTVLRSLRPNCVGQEYTVSHIKGKSVYFTNGQYENMRSMFHYEIVSI